ncbi:MAG TPA: sigma-70 family RNA polymerase sigma factor [Planctomycetota bacterium]|nr:sigma-70 family RNA polymerase sigma factor [Planctomycetota bacterium]
MARTQRLRIAGGIVDWLSRAASRSRPSAPAKPPAAETGAAGAERADPGALFRSAHRGDREEFDRLMATYGGFIARAVEERMDPLLRSVMQAEDVVQDVLIAVYRGIGEAVFESEGKFLGWLGTIVHNEVNDLRRRHFCQRRGGGPPLSLDEPGPGEGSDVAKLGEAIPTDDTGPISAAGRREQMESLEVVLSRLRPHHRQVIRLAVIEGLPTREIAARVGKRVETVRKMLERALEACRVALRAGPPDREGKGTT